MDVPLCQPLVTDLSSLLSVAMQEDYIPRPENDHAFWLPCGMEREPFGDTPYLKIVQLYEMQAGTALRHGAKSALLYCPTCLSEARAAAFGASRVGLPLQILFSVDSQGNVSPDTSLLSSLVTLQGLGVSQVGILPREEGDWSLLLQEMASYCSIPLGIVLDASASKRFRSLLQDAPQLPVSFVYTIGEPTTEELYQAKKAFSLPKKPFAPIPHREALIPVCSSQPFFLGDNFEISTPIPCSLDMSEDFLSAEESGYDVLHVEVDTQEDAYNLGLNAHMARLPLWIRSHSAPCLEWALLHYHGRAIVDSRSWEEPEIPQKLAKQYNAILL